MNKDALFLEASLCIAIVIAVIGLAASIVIQLFIWLTKRLIRLTRTRSLLF